MRSRALAACCLALAAAPAPAQPVRVVAAGDIACDPGHPSFNSGAGTDTACRMAATSDLALLLEADAVLLLGDNQYEFGALAGYEASYDPSWGRLKALTYPAPGNHDYGTPGAAGYYAYFGAEAGDPAEGWHSFELGDWHLVALNSNCAAVGGCGAGSPQAQWLAADLAGHAGKCILAYWHHPRFSSGPHGSDATYQAFWETLATAGADLVLNGHDHVYERFAPQDPAGVLDPAGGIRQITVGTGGRSLTGFPLVRPNSEARQVAFGVLELELYANGYAWRFLPEGGQGASDQGVALCHGALPSRAASFYTLPPCRLVDTRHPVGPAGGPALAAGDGRSFPVAGACGVPADAVAVAVNLTAVSPGGAGRLTLFPTGGLEPATSTVSFSNRTRAVGAVLALGVGGELSARCTLSPAQATTHLVLDVSGYFR
jgi:3',5'-cyclic AMP phosphodiesterase CpdA